MITIKKIELTALQVFLAILLFFCFSFKANAQENENEVSIKIIARSQSNKILLRWAVTTPSAWLKANKYGYHIQRYTVSRNGVLLPTPEKKLLTPTPIIPNIIEDWENLINNNDYAAILAQAIYGDSFLVEGMEEGGDLAQIINKSQEAEQRFSFALFAADMNFEAAKMAALGYEDITIKSGEEYLYRIETAIPETLLIVKPGSVVVKSEEPKPLPSPIDLIAVPDDKTILLTWDYEMFKNIFTSYYIEKSENGSDFKRLGDLPLVNLNEQPNTVSKRMQYIDTISQNNKRYHYRVKGITPFGEESLPSEAVSARGIKKLSAAPHISKHKLEKSGNAVIEWEFLKEAEEEITGFELNWATKKEGPYKIVRSNLLPSSRKAEYNKLSASNYFTVTALGKNNQQRESMAAFVQTIDSIPPAPPIGLIGVIDTLGIVELKWDASTEKDILGYRVFRGNLENEEVSQITISPLTKNIFRDSVQLKSLNSNVFYQVVAVDQRFNISEYSEKIMIKKPDIVPPSSPIFLKYKVMNDGVFLKWINSSSDDVISHQLYRQNTVEPNEGWELIFKTDTITSFTDKTMTSDLKYRYAIFAEDDSELMSEPSTPISVVFKNLIPENNIIRGFTIIADREKNKLNLNWKKMSSEVVEILIYKSKKEEKPVLWKQISGSINSLEDSSVSPNNIYVYQLKAVTSNGGQSAIKTKEIEF